MSTYCPLESPEDPAVFYRFLELPRELRDLAYEFYFESAYVDSRYLVRVETQETSLVFASRQLYKESVDLMYKKATLLVRLEKTSAPPEAPDVIGIWESHALAAEYRSVPLEKFRKFRNVFLHLAAAQGDWRYAYPIMMSYLCVLSEGQHVRVRLDVGELSQEEIFSQAPRRLFRMAFGMNNFSAPEKEIRDKGGCEEGCKIHNCSPEECNRIAKRLRALPEKRLEGCCMLSAMNLLGRQAQNSRARFYVRKIGGETKDIASNNLCDLVAETNGFLGGREGYLCMEGVWRGYCKGACKHEG